tara:strand:+ start:289 stop:435 length:147 start_codon:yes stop_codon:yes gene_type:complete
LLAEFFFDDFLSFPVAKVADLSIPKLSVSISKVSVEGGCGGESLEEEK